MSNMDGQGRKTLAVTVVIAWPRSHASAHSRTSTRTRTSCDRVVRAKHTNSGAELGASQGNHVLSDMGSNDFAMLGGGIVKNPLNEIVAVLVTCNVNQWDASTVTTTFTDSVQVATKEFCASNFETLLDDL
jgi:hypothetical protein